MADLVCAVALHPDGTPLRVAVDLDGPHLIRTALKPGAAPAPAAARLLYDFAGLETRAALYLGAADLPRLGGRWHFALCRTVSPVRDLWQQAGDDGVRRFGWHPLGAATGPDADALVRLAAIVTGAEDRA